MAGEFAFLLSGTRLARATQPAAAPAAQHTASVAQHPELAREDASRAPTAVSDVDDAPRCTDRKPYFYNVKAGKLAPLGSLAPLSANLAIRDFETARATIHPALLAYLQQEAQFTALTDVQRLAFGLVPSGLNLAFIAPTGSGKTFAFLIPIFSTLLAAKSASAQYAASEDSALADAPVALCLAPTRELTHQIFRLAAALVKHCEGVTACSLLSSKLAHAELCNFWVSTPGLALSAKAEKLRPQLTRVHYLIVDEMDAVLSGDFCQQLALVYAGCSNLRQQLYFSATIPDKVLAAVCEFAPDITVVTLGSFLVVPSTIQQRLISVNDDRQKLLALTQLLLHQELPAPALVFVQDGSRAEMLAQKLSELKLRAAHLTAEMLATQRQATLDAFAAARLDYLVSTDLAARGLDIKGIQAILNFDLPLSREAYIHRIGRTGRCGQHGLSVTFYTQKDLEFIRLFLSVFTTNAVELPEEFRKLQKVAPATVARKYSKRAPIAHLTKQQRREATVRQLRLRARHRSTRSKLDDLEGAAALADASPRKPAAMKQKPKPLQNKKLRKSKKSDVE